MKTTPEGIRMSVLIGVSDDALAELLLRSLPCPGVPGTRLATGRELIAAASTRRGDLLVLDYALPDMTAADVLTALGRSGAVPPVIVIAGFDDARAALELMKHGARECVVRDGLLTHRLPITVERVLREVDAERRTTDSLRRLRAAFEQDEDSLMLLDGETILDANTAAVALFGLPGREHLVGLSLADVLAGAQPDGRLSREVAGASVAAALRGGAQRFEWTHQRADGSRAPVEVRLVPFELGERRLLRAEVRHLATQKCAEDALKESESRFSHLFSANVAGVALHEIICDSQGRPCDYRFVDVNPAFESMTGLSAARVIGRTVLEVLPDTELSWIERYGRVALTGEPEHFSSFSSALGRHFEVTAYCPRPGQFAVVFLDVTARAEAKAALEQDEAELAAIYDHAPAIICMLDEHARVIRANLAAAAFAGRDGEALRGGSYGSLVNCRHVADDSGGCGLGEACNSCTLRMCIQQGLDAGRSRHQVEWLCPVERGGRHEDLALLCSIAPVHIENRRRVLLVLEDVTSRRESERRLREQAALLDVAHDAILVQDLAGRVIYWNKGAERLYGWCSAEAIGRSGIELLHRGPVPAVVSSAVHHALERGEWSDELVQVTRDQREVTVQSRWTLVRDASGRATSILIVNTDITEKKQLASHLLRSQRLESVGTLASGIAHDLNNVLSPIVMSMHLLRGMIVDGNGVGILDTIEQCSRRAADIVRQMLSFARGSSGERVLLQPKIVVHEIARIVRETFPRSIEVRSDFSHGLGTIRADHTLIQQVLMNLCVNARDAMPTGGVLSIGAEGVVLPADDPSLHARAKAGGYVVLSVRDTGTGIAPEHMERIFDPFFTTKPMGKGTGLGLAVSLSIIEKHEGFIHITSSLGEGSTFRVFLPVAAGESLELLSDPVAGEFPSGRGETILVVDDEVAVRVTLMGTLSRWGYRTLAAKDGAEAVVLYRRHSDEIALVLTDLLMAGIDGFELIRLVLRQKPTARIIAMTGLGEEEHLAKAKLSGALAVLEKPFSTKHLLRSIDRTIRLCSEVDVR